MNPKDQEIPENRCSAPATQPQKAPAAGWGTQVMNNNMIWKDIDSIPKDGTEILIRLPEGAVSAWYCGSQRTGEWWVCFDDMFRLEGEDNNIIGWKPFRR